MKDSALRTSFTSEVIFNLTKTDRSRLEQNNARWKAMRPHLWLVTYRL